MGRGERNDANKVEIATINDDKKESATKLAKKTMKKGMKKGSKTAPHRPEKKKIAFDFVDEQELLTVDFERMERAVSKILADAGVERGRMEIAVVSAVPMREMNVRFLGHDYSTDVLAFPLEDDLENGFLEGNVVVCSDVAAERASEFGWTPEEELLLYVIHGSLHLVGYDDHTPEDAPTMRAKEREYLAFVGVDGSRADA